MNTIAELLMKHKNSFALVRPHPRFPRTTRKVKIRAFHSWGNPEETDIYFYPSSLSYEKARETGHYIFLSARDLREKGCIDLENKISFGSHECWTDCPCPLIISL